MFRTTKLCTGLMVACGGVLLSAGQAAHAQAQPAAPVPGQTLERVEITGSNIRRINSETASPVQTITREDIDKSSRTSVAELLQTLSIDSQGSVPKSFGNGFAAGGSGISIRGLGVAGTLVLLNGRRVAPYGLADDGRRVFVDLNVIPLEAVERVEILKDGGSAIYGSDAVAGVVNIILRKDYQGLATNVSYGTSKYWDGKEKRASLTGGYGDLGVQGFNILGNLEVGKQDQIYYRDRSGRDHIGRTDLRDLGFSAQEALGGAGAITSNNAAGAAINGNVRNPITNDYYNRGNLAGFGFTRTFPGAACSNFTNHPQGDPGGGCLIDGTQVYGQVQPEQKYVNFFARGTLNVTSALQAYGEFNYYNNKSESFTTPASVSGNAAFPSTVAAGVSNAAVSLSANHPDNPYFGTAARLRYSAADVGPRTSNTDSDFYRVVAGIKGTVASWDVDSAFLFSQNKLTNTRGGFLQRDVAFALLNPTAFSTLPGTLTPSTRNNAAVAAANSAAYAALPAGSLWRIAENAGLNSAALYAALAPRISSDAKSKVTQIDVKAQRELMALDGGPLGLAVGAEFRREEASLTPTTGTERGNVIGLGYSAFDGARNVFATYAELLAPVIKQVEISAALRYDHYTDAGSSTTPKFGVKYTPVRELALRGTYARGFRAPSVAENGTGATAFFTPGIDAPRCALGVALACGTATLAGISFSNPDLKPEKSNNYTIGLVFEPTSKTSIALDYFDLTRKNEINPTLTSVAIAAGMVSRDPSTSTMPGDPGAITAVFEPYANSAKTKVRGLDLDARQGFDVGGFGRVTLTAQWTHLFTLKRTEKDGTSFEFAGTHGDCDLSSCTGTPDDKVNLGAFLDSGPFRIGANLQYRDSIQNRAFKGEPCGSSLANGSDAPSGCRIGSFTTVDLVGRWAPMKNLEIYGSIRNILDRVAPFDPFSAGAVNGAVSYNPMDAVGAVGRFYSIGLRYKFF